MWPLGTCLVWALIVAAPRGRRRRPGGGVAQLSKDSSFHDEQLLLLRSELDLCEAAAEELLKHTALLDGDLLAKVRFLRTELNYPKARLREMISAHPKLMASCLMDDLESNISCLAKSLRLSEDELRQVTSQVPALLRYDRQNMRERVAALTSAGGLALTPEDARIIVLRCPTLLRLRGAEGRYRGLREVLRELLNCGEKEVLKIIKRYPCVLKYSPEAYYGNMEALRQATHMDEADARRVFQRVPEALVYGVESNHLRHKLASIKECCGFDDEDLRKVCKVYPSILKLSVKKNLEPKLLAIREFFEFSEEDLRRLLIENKSVIGQSLENNLKPKFEFFQGPLLAPLSRRDIGERLLDRPRILSLSLEGSIRPRFQRLRDAGISVEQFSRWRFLEWSDSRFKLFMDGLAPCLENDHLISQFDGEAVRARVSAVLRDEESVLSATEKDAVAAAALRTPYRLKPEDAWKKYCVVREAFRCLGSSDDDVMAIIGACPRILLYSPEMYFLCIDTLRETTGLNNRTLGEVIRKTPNIFYYSVKTGSRFIRSKAATIKQHCGFDDDDLRFVCRHIPRILTMSAEKTIVPKMEAIRDELDMSLPEMRRLLLSNTAVFGMSLEKNIKPKLKILSGPLLAPLSRREIRDKVLEQSRIFSLSNERLRQRIQRLHDTGIDLRQLPSWQCLFWSDAKYYCSIETDSCSIDSSVALIKQHCGLNDEDLEVFCRLCPQVLRRSTEKTIVPKLKAIQDHFDFSPPEMRHLLLTNTAILGMSLQKSITPKLEIFTGPLLSSLSRREIRDRVLEHSQAFSLSNDRLRQRFQRLHDSGMDLQRIPSWQFLFWSDSKFDALVAKVYSNSNLTC